MNLQRALGCHRAHVQASEMFNVTLMIDGKNIKELKELCKNCLVNSFYVIDSSQVSSLCPDRLCCTVAAVYSPELVKSYSAVAESRDAALPASQMPPGDPPVCSSTLYL